MYWAFVLHGILPSVIENMGLGEKRVLSVLITKELEEKERLYK